MAQTKPNKLLEAMNTGPWSTTRTIDITVKERANHWTASPNYGDQKEPMVAECQDLNE